MAYLNIEEVESSITSLASAYPTLTTLITLPHLSIEGRTCHALRIGKSAASSRDIVLFSGGVHAREWGSSEICVFFAADLLEAYSLGTGLSYGGKSFTANHVKAIVEGLNVLVFPDVNPDGRNFSQTVEALWRKNRNPAESGGSAACIGCDLNRNHDFLWDFPNLFSPSAIVNTSANPCDGSQTYRGSAPASEPETQNLVWLFENFPRIRWYVDLHSSGELILFSWGNDENQTSDMNMNFENGTFNNVRGVDGDTAYKEFIGSSDLNVAVNLANSMHGAIQSVRGKNYSVGQAFDLYATSGAGDDYAYSRHFQDPTKNKVISFTVEWGTEFQPSWTEMEKIVADLSAGMVEFCLKAPCESNSVVAELTTPSLEFNDIPELETSVRAAVFSVRSCQPVSFQIVSGPTTTSGPANSFSAHISSATLPATTDVATLREARIWIAYTGTNDGDTAAGSVTVKCNETNEEWTIPIHANTIKRPTVAVSLVLDQSASMDWASGFSAPLDKRIDVLKFSALPFVDIIQPGNALGVAAFDHDPHPVMPVTAAGP